MQRGRTRSRNSRGRGRGVSRGGSRFSRGRYHSSRSSSRYSRSSSNQGDVSRATDKLTNLVQNISSRLERLERGEGAGPRIHERDQAPTAPTAAATDRTDRNTTDPLSFHVFKYVQTFHHQRNWSHCPRAVARNVDNLVDNINPPNITDGVRKALSDAAEKFKDDVACIVRTHLNDKLDSHLHEITAYDTVRVTEAEATAKRFMRKRQRFSRITDATITEALRDLGSKLEERELSRIEESPAVPPRTSKTTDKGSKRFASPALMGAAKKPHSVDDTDAILIQAEIHASSTGTPVANPLPQRTLHRSMSNPDLPASIANLGDRIRSDTQTLVIADSNGKQLAEAGLTRGAVLALPGLAIKRACDIIQSLDTRIQRIPNIVLAVGINNCKDLDPAQSITALKGLVEWGRKTGHRVCFSNVPDCTRFAEIERQGINRINKFAREIFGLEFIDAVDPTRVEINPHDITGVHYNRDTAVRYCTAIAQHLNV